METTPAAPGPARPRRHGWRYLALTLALLALLAVAVRLAWLWADPLGERTTDRSQPVLLRSIHDLSRFEAATGSFQVVVDLEKDAAFLPDAIKGTRTLFVGYGSVDAYLDFAGLGKNAVRVNGDRTEATVTIPRAQLEKPNLDNSRSYVFARQRGFVDRVSDFLADSPPDQRELYTLAERRIGEAALAGDLRGRAEANAKRVLEGLLKSLGFSKVTVTLTGEG